MDKALEYARLDQMKKGIEARLAELRNEIKLGEGEHDLGSYTITVQIKDRTKLDLDIAAQICTDKGLVQCFKLVPDPDWIEAAYLEGYLTDSDLREMRKPQYSTAYIVRQKNVQG